MQIPAFLRFEPVPVRPRGDGWSPALQRRFILNLARGMGPDEAARALGRSRQSVYSLRKKTGAEGFAAAWDSALAFSRKAGRVAHANPLAALGSNALLVPRFYRGRLVGFTLRDDQSGVLRNLARLDRVAQNLGTPRSDEPDFTALLESLAGELWTENCRN